MTAALVAQLALNQRLPIAAQELVLLARFMRPSSASAAVFLAKTLHCLAGMQHGHLSRRIKGFALQIATLHVYC
jgi:hypothetical protein